MDPSRCTIVYLQQTSTIEPFAINDNNNNNDENDSTHLLESVFGQVSVQQNLTGTMDYIKNNNNSNDTTLLLVDLDTITTMDNKDEMTSYLFSCSTTTCSTFNDARIHWLQRIIRDLSNIPVVVCSKEDSSSLMLDCIHAGAADFILKPFRLDVIKTLFLKLHQSNTDYRKHVHDSLNQRIKNMTLKDTQLSNMLMKIYGPQSSIAKSILEVNNESELQSSLYHWDFSPFGQSQQDLIQCAYNIFDLLLKLPELYHLSMTKDQLYGFLTDLANVYHDENPYHNFAHAVDVLQCLFFMLCEMGVLPFTSKRKKGLLLRPSDAFSLLIAAIGHDAAHPGVNNLFLINSATPLAVLYNDRSVLESLHSMTLFQILRNHHILDHLEPTIYKDDQCIL
ncbi:HD-domain/PDEase-like protein [Backusella circina FSU 941]|nr:HD-domain/PDEase-like protein [Backusella circina FSU 941]